MNKHADHARQFIGRACPCCGNRQLFVIESRHNKNGTHRRRLHCAGCEWRGTTYEISKEMYDSLLEAKNAFEAMQRIFGSKEAAPKDKQLPCYDCKFLMPGAICSYGLPEAMTHDAVDCTYLQKIPA